MYTHISVYIYSSIHTHTHTQTDTLILTKVKMADSRSFLSFKERKDLTAEVNTAGQRKSTSWKSQ